MFRCRYINTLQATRTRMYFLSALLAHKQYLALVYLGRQVVVLVLLFVKLVQKIHNHTSELTSLNLALYVDIRINSKERRQLVYIEFSKLNGQLCHRQAMKSNKDTNTQRIASSIGPQNSLSQLSYMYKTINRSSRISRLTSWSNWLLHFLKILTGR